MTSDYSRSNDGVCLQVASKVIWQVVGVFMILLGVFGKFGAALTVLPDPIKGGLLMLGLGKFHCK